MPIYRSCYTTREDVRRSLDVKQAAYNNDQIDRQIQLASDSVDELCKRYFYPIDAVRKWDWPNFQYTYPWKVYFDQHGLIVLTQLNSGGVIIPNNGVLLYPPNEGPPYTWLELNRSLNNSFGNGPTPQMEINIQGTWGWWLNSFPVGTLASAISTTAQPTMQITVAGTMAGVGDTLFVESERMIVTDKSYVTTGQTQQGAGCSTASPADNALTVTDGTQFFVGDVLQLDAEWMNVLSITGNVLLVKRAWDGSVLSTHSGATIYAARLLTVLRGQLGTTAATHAQNTSVTALLIPGLVKELATAEAEFGLIQSTSGYANNVSTIYRGNVTLGGTTKGQQKEPLSGIGIPDLRERCANQYGRVARTRVI